MFLTTPFKIQGRALLGSRREMVWVQNNFATYTSGAVRSGQLGVETWTAHDLFTRADVIVSPVSPRQMTVHVDSFTISITVLTAHAQIAGAMVCERKNFWESGTGTHFKRFVLDSLECFASAAMGQSTRWEERVMLMTLCWKERRLMAEVTDCCTLTWYSRRDWWCGARIGLIASDRPW